MLPLYKQLRSIIYLCVLLNAIEICVESFMIINHTLELNQRSEFNRQGTEILRKRTLRRRKIDGNSASNIVSRRVNNDKTKKHNSGPENKSDNNATKRKGEKKGSPSSNGKLPPLSSTKGANNNSAQNTNATTISEGKISKSPQKTKQANQTLQQVFNSSEPENLALSQNESMNRTNNSSASLNFISSALPPKLPHSKDNSAKSNANESQERNVDDSYSGEGGTIKKTGNVDVSIEEENTSVTVLANDDSLAETIQSLQEVGNSSTSPPSTLRDKVEDILDFPTFPPTSLLEEIEDLEILDELVREGAVEIDDDGVEEQLEKVNQLNEIAKEYENGTISVDDDELAEVIEVVEEAEEESSFFLNTDDFPTFPPTTLQEEIEDLEILDELVKQGEAEIDDDDVEEKLAQIDEWNEIAEQYENGTMSVDDDEIIEMINVVEEAEEESSLFLNTYDFATLPPTTLQEEIEDLEILDELVKQGEVEIDDDDVEEKIEMVNELNEIAEEFENGTISVDDDDLIDTINVVEEAKEEESYLFDTDDFPTLPPTSLKDEVENLEHLDELVKEGIVDVDDDEVKEELDQIEAFETFEEHIREENPSSGQTTLNEMVDMFEEEQEMKEIEDLEIVEELYENGTIELDDDDFIDVLEEVKELEEKGAFENPEIQENDDDDQNLTYVSLDDDPLLEGTDNDPFTQSPPSQSNGLKYMSYMVIISLIAMIYTSYQVSENPDGAFASVCRLCASIASFLCKIFLIPFRKLFGKSSTHHPISSADYREPYRASNSTFVIS